MSLRILLAAEGSGGHLIPALETARALVEREHSVVLLVAQRSGTAALFDALTREPWTRAIVIRSIDLAPAGHGPTQGRLQSEGNPYLRAEFPELDYIVSARVL